MWQLTSAIEIMCARKSADKVPSTHVRECIFIYIYREIRYICLIMSNLCTYLQRLWLITIFSNNKTEMEKVISLNTKYKIIYILCHNFADNNGWQVWNSLFGLSWYLVMVTSRRFVVVYVNIMLTGEHWTWILESAATQVQSFWKT